MSTLTCAPQPMTLEMAREVTEKIIRDHSKTFYFATRLLPGRARSAIHALYAFCRATDDLVDQQGAQVEDLEAWRAEALLPRPQQTHAVLYAWAAVREQYPIDLQYQQELIDGVRMDLTRHSYATWAELETYCYRVASTVGLLSMPIIGLAEGAAFERAAAYAAQLGSALQLTNILRDVGEDLNRGRIYLPEEDLARFGLTLADIRRQTFDERFIGLMQFEIERARQLYEAALPGITLLNRAAQPAVAAAALLYRAILDEIEAIGYQVYTRRAHTSGLKKIRMMPGILRVIRDLPPVPPAQQTGR